MNILVIKKEELRHNIKQIKELAEKTGKDDKGNSIKIIATIKENGYGLGTIEYAKFLIENGISFFAVETTEEAVMLRQGGIKHEILMLSNTALKEDIETLVKNDITISLGSKQDIEIAEKIGKEQKKKIKAHISINTGIGIQGFNYNNRDEMIEALKSIENIKIEGTFSKFDNSLEKDKNTKAQFNRFIDVVEVLQMNKIETGILHICDEIAFLRYSNMYLNGIRIEKAFIGDIPLNTNVVNLRKSVYLETKISEIKQLPKGFCVGNYKTKKETKIAIIPYECKNNEQSQFIIINKNKFKIIGNIENNIICDIGNKDIKVGEKVIFPINSSNVSSYVRKEYR